MAYDIPWPEANQGSSMAIAQFQGVSYDVADLNDFQRECHLDWSLIPAHTYGYNNQGWCKNVVTSDICLESLLDIEYIKGVGGDIPLSVISDTDYSLLRWTHVVGSMTDPPPVHSVSYGNDEVQQDSVEYMDAVNDQFMLLGVRGISILFASGDMGVYGRTGVTKDGKFHPDFPASSPYLTAVGGTNFVRQGVIGPEESWDGSGGGFSDHFPMPLYQKEAVEQYLIRAENRNGFPAERHFNRTNRGYPDISALGGVRNAYCVDTTFLFGAHVMMGVGGTSASCPVVAGIFARLNTLRERNNLPPLGFLNPFIYQNSDAFKDVKKGNNRWEGSEGFRALKGWDPATGVGTPSFAELAKRVLAMPNTTLRSTAGPSPEPTPEPTAPPTIDPSPEPVPPTMEPSPEPTPKTTAPPTTDPSLEPTLDPSAPTTIDPTPDPTPETTAPPTTQRSPEPTPTPIVSPTADPSWEPAPETNVPPSMTSRPSDLSSEAIPMQTMLV